MSMRILLTGATGFIGSHVARALLARGHEVHAVTRPSSDRRRIRDLEPALKLHEGAFDEPPVRADVTIHLAWTTEPGKYIASPENGELLEKSRRLLDRLQGRAIFAGTCFEFDTTIGTLREDSPTRPTNPYAQSKDALRQEVEKRPNSAWIRFFYQYGPWEDERRFVPSILRKLARGEEVKVSPGEQQRDYLHVEDVASAACAVAESDLTGCVNVGSGSGPTVKDIVTRLGALAGRPDLIRLGAVPYWDGEPMKIVADITRLRSTGWAPRYDLDAGLRHTFEWWRGRP